jgi:hypothetical protein
VQFPDINCLTLLLVGYILEYTYDARTHKRYIDKGVALRTGWLAYVSLPHKNKTNVKVDVEM